MNSWTLRERALETLSKEVGYVTKPHGDRLRVALAFPNTYWVGMSNLGFQTVYRLFNAQDDVVCERFFLPPKQELAELLATNTRLVTLESQTPVADFDVIAFSVSFEWDYVNVLTLLPSGIPLLPLAFSKSLVHVESVTFREPEPLVRRRDCGGRQVLCLAVACLQGRRQLRRSARSCPMSAASTSHRSTIRITDRTARWPDTTCRAAHRCRSTRPHSRRPKRWTRR
jgi:hypothetical protein